MTATDITNIVSYVWGLGMATFFIVYMLVKSGDKK